MVYVPTYLYIHIYIIDKYSPYRFLHPAPFHLHFFFSQYKPAEIKSTKISH